MPNLDDQPVLGGPTQPVFIMNGLTGVGASPMPVGSAPANSALTSGFKAAAGNNTILAAPGAGYRIVVYAMQVQNESATATLVQLVDQATRFRWLLEQYRIGIGWDWRLNENTALIMHLGGANQIGYWLMYSIEPV